MRSHYNRIRLQRRSRKDLKSSLQGRLEALEMTMMRAHRHFVFTFRCSQPEDLPGTALCTQQWGKPRSWREVCFPIRENCFRWHATSPLVSHARSLVQTRRNRLERLRERKGVVHPMSSKSLKRKLVEKMISSGSSFQAPYRQLGANGTASTTLIASLLRVNDNKSTLGEQWLQTRPSD